MTVSMIVDKLKRSLNRKEFLSEADLKAPQAAVPNGKPVETDVIVTVRGAIAPEEIGFCQSHEHLSVENAHLRAVAPELVIDDVSRTLVDLRAYRQSGGRTVVDAQPVGAGRNAAALRFLSEAADAHVIASTGFHRLGFYPPGHWIFEATEERLAALFSEELIFGMYLDGDEGFPEKRSEIRAGQVKAALEPGSFGKRQAALFRAAARAASASGAPLMVHIERGSNPMMLVDFLLDCGLPPERAVFCHMDRAVVEDAGLKTHKAICDRGVTLEYDTIARPRVHSEAAEIAIFREMLNEGFGDRLLAGLDVTRARLTGYGGSPGLSYILETFLPLLRASGADETDIQRIFVENPARIWRSQRTK